MSSFHPSFDRKETHLKKMNPHFHTPLERVLCRFMYKTWMEGTYDIHVPNKNPHFFVTSEPNRMGFCQNADN